MPRKIPLILSRSFRREHWHCSADIKGPLSVNLPELPIRNFEEFEVGNGKNYLHSKNYYKINSETIMDVNNYIPFSTINSQAIDVMYFWCSKHGASNQSCTTLHYIADKLIRKPLWM